MKDAKSSIAFMGLIFLNAKIKFENSNGWAMQLYEFNLPKAFKHFWRRLLIMYMQIFGNYSHTPLTFPPSALKVLIYPSANCTLSP